MKKRFNNHLKRIKYIINTYHILPRMSASQSRAKVIPNRLVLKHEEYLINKSLANKVMHVKSTINTGGKVLFTRQKKE